MTVSTTPEMMKAFDMRLSRFSNSPLDRRNNLRYDENFSDLLPQKTHTLVFTDSFIFLAHKRDKSSSPNRSVQKLAFLENKVDLDKTLPLSTYLPELILGTHAGITYKAVALRRDCDVDSIIDTLEGMTKYPVAFIHLRTTYNDFSESEAAIAAHARSLFEFHKRHQFCGLCGSATISQQGGSRRRCCRNVHSAEPHAAHTCEDTCNGMWFPRTDPVVIMLVLDHTGEKVLLGRQSRFPRGMYSCLAGFMEHAEGIEDAVRREIKEESGVSIGRVRMFGSQPWPFPYSLMIGCVAQSTEENLSVDVREIEDVGWYSREQVREMVDARALLRKKRGGDGDMGSDETILFVPPSTTIAGQMCEAFANGDIITSFTGKEPHAML